MMEEQAAGPDFIIGFDMMVDSNNLCEKDTVETHPYEEWTLCEKDTVETHPYEEWRDADCASPASHF
jgi:hypothetical protein